MATVSFSGESPWAAGSRGSASGLGLGFACGWLRAGLAFGSGFLMDFDLISRIPGFCLSSGFHSLGFWFGFYLIWLDFGLISAGFPFDFGMDVCTLASFY